MTGSVAVPVYNVFCHYCGKRAQPNAQFCVSCGKGIPPTSAIVPSTSSPIHNNLHPEFERNLRVAWSCLGGMQDKIEEITKAANATQEEIDSGSFRGSLAKSAYQSDLETELQGNLNLAWQSAVTALNINANGSVAIDGFEVTPNTIFATVYGHRGDLMFNFGKWDEAIAFYSHCLQCAPHMSAACNYNIGAAYTNKHEPPHAIEAFKRVIAFDPMGHYGIEAAKALQKLQTGRIGTKSFTGSWKVVAILGGLTLFSLLMMDVDPGRAIMYLFLWGGILALYCWRKYK